MTWERLLGEGLPKADGEPRPTPVLRGLAQCVCGDVKAAVRLCVCNRLVRVGLGHGAPASQMGGHLLQCRGVCVCVCVDRLVRAEPPVQGSPRRGDGGRR